VRVRHFDIPGLMGTHRKIPIRKITDAYCKEASMKVRKPYNGLGKRK
jgi:hypothetical protein